MRSLLATILVLCAAVTRPTAVAVDTDPQVYFFWAASDGHSLNAHTFLIKAQINGRKIRVRMFEVEQNVFNAMLLAKVYERIGLPGPALVPLTVIGKHVIIGYMDEDTTGREVLKRIAECRKAGCPDAMRDLVDGASDASLPDARGPLGFRRERAAWRMLIGIKAMEPHPAILTTASRRSGGACTGGRFAVGASTEHQHRGRPAGAGRRRLMDGRPCARA